MRKVFSLAVAIAAGAAVAWVPVSAQRAFAQDSKEPAVKKQGPKEKGPKEKGLSATPAKSFRAPEGFEVEMVYEVPSKEQGSWVAMCVDLKGRLIVSDQYGKLYRVTPGAEGKGSETKVEPINVNLGMAQGLLHTKDGLYVDVNGEGILDKEQKDAPRGPGLYRLQDLDGDEQFEKIERIIPLTGGGEHGPQIRFTRAN